MSPGLSEARWEAPRPTSYVQPMQYPDGLCRGTRLAGPAGVGFSLVPVWWNESNIEVVQRLVG